MVILPALTPEMEAFDIRRVELCSSESSREWFLLNSIICGCAPSRFMSRCPLVKYFPSEFATVKISDIENGGLLDARQCRNDEVPVASRFGVVCAILRNRNPKGDERENYVWLVDAINSLPIDQNCEAKRESSSTKHPELPDIETENLKLKADLQLALSQLEAVQRLQAENLKLKEDLELALSQLEAIRCEVEKPVITDHAQESAEQVIPGNDDVWTLISDVHKKYQVPLASAIADQVHDSKVAKLLSDVAEQLITKSGPKRAFDAMFGDNGPLYFQSLRVPDWTLLYFKLQARIPDQGWQTLLSLTKLGRTGVSCFCDLFTKMKCVISLI